MKTITYVIALFVLLKSVNSLAQNTSQINEKQISEINQLVEDLTNKDKFSGTVLVSKGNKIIYQKAVGLSDKAKNIQNNIDTKFNLASMNKMFTGIAIAQLVKKINYHIVM